MNLACPFNSRVVGLHATQHRQLLNSQQLATCHTIVADLHSLVATAAAAAAAALANMPLPSVCRCGGALEVHPVVEQRSAEPV
jgi:predicted Kef-type K+ transport protein